MEENQILSILETMGQICISVEHSALAGETLEQINPQLQRIAVYLDCNPMQALFFCLVVEQTLVGDSTNLRNMMLHLGCSAFQIAGFVKDLQVLENKGLIHKQRSRRRVLADFSDAQYVASSQVMTSILDNTPVPEIKMDKNSDVMDLLAQVDMLGEQVSDDQISATNMLDSLKITLQSARQIPLVAWMDALSLPISDKFILMYTIWKAVSGRDSILLTHVMERLYNLPMDRIRKTQQILRGENLLIKSELLELEESQFLNETELRPCSKLTDKLHTLGIYIGTKQRKWDNLILPEQIQEKELIYNADELKQLGPISEILKEERLQEIYTKLRASRLPAGVTALLYGASGTGKTESVLQFARQSGRAIMKVDMSKVKSVWFGQSERAVKRIFKEYEVLASESEVMPILLFNEADALISKRKDVGSSNVSQTENAMQNILLEEMENFEGILIATSNLVINIDTAFERRFLFKVEFYKPDPELKARIWKLKLPGLSMSECLYLARNFDFSGGQIENIARKLEIDQIIGFKEDEFQRIRQHCSVEQLVVTHPSIGFKAAS